MKRSPPPKRSHASIVVSRKTWGLLKAESDRTGKPMSQIVSELLEPVLKENDQ